MKWIGVCRLACDISGKPNAVFSACKALRLKWMEIDVIELISPVVSHANAQDRIDQRYCNTALFTVKILIEMDRRLTLSN